ncbi:hypothetical protein [Mycobacterium scrofulaceum]|nr:hypothetical protein [Mycobacterium scrofulaceum]
MLINPTAIDQVRVANPEEIARAIHADVGGLNVPDGFTHTGCAQADES